MESFILLFNSCRCWRAWWPMQGQPEQRAVTWPTPCWTGPTVSCYLGRPPRDCFLWSRLQWCTRCVFQTLCFVTLGSLITPLFLASHPLSDLQGSRGGHFPPAAVWGVAPPHSSVLWPHWSHRHRGGGVLLQMLRWGHHSSHHQWQVDQPTFARGLF